MKKERGLLKLRESIHSKVLRLRSVLNIVCKPQFGVLWDSSDKEQKKEVNQYIDNADKEAISNWMRNHPSITPSEMSYRQLSKLARKLQIPNYSRLDKVALISECERRLNNEED